MSMLIFLAPARRSAFIIARPPRVFVAFISNPLWLARYEGPFLLSSMALARIGQCFHNQRCRPCNPGT